MSKADIYLVNLILLISSFGSIYSSSRSKPSSSAASAVEETPAEVPIAAGLIYTFPPTYMKEVK